MIKTTLFNTFDKGGAGVAAHRLHEALNASGSVQSSLVYLHGQADGRDNNVKVIANNTLAKKIALARLAWEKLLFSFHEKSREERFRFSTAKMGLDITPYPLLKDSDIIHLHWINNGLLSLKYIKKLAKLKKPVVWTMHDMWAFTGGCHHSRHCNYYINECGNCFYLKSPSDNDLSHKIHVKKRDAYKNLDLTFIACSNWLAGRARESSLLKDRRVEVIPNPIDTDKYKPADKVVAKAKFGVAPDAVCISFVAANITDARKGFEYLRKSLWQLKEKMPDAKNINLLVMGEAKADVNMDLPYPSQFTGYLRDEEKIIDFYNASDVFVLPSLEENLPNTIMEALSCGVPAVAFNVGGIPDLIAHKQNGYLANYESVDDLTTGLSFVLSEIKQSATLQQNARNKALAEYSYPVVAARIDALYAEVLQKKPAL